MNSECAFGMDEILSVLPHRPPFLFVDRVTRLVPFRSITAERALREDEPHFAGHFPARRIMPGVLITEALAQTSGLLLGLSRRGAATDAPTAPPMFYLAANTMKYTATAAPGETLTLKAESEAGFGALFRFQVEATAGRRLIASGSLTLALIEGRL